MTTQFRVRCEKAEEERDALRLKNEEQASRVAELEEKLGHIANDALEGRTRDSVHEMRNWLDAIARRAQGGG